MKEKIFVTGVSNAAWETFNRERFFWILAALGNLAIINGFNALSFYVPHHHLAVGLCGAFIHGIYIAILHKKALDEVYRRKVNLLNVTPSILCAALFFVVPSLYRFLPAYAPLLMLHIPKDFTTVALATCAIHIVLIYLFIRCMFVGMILLEEKSNLVEAFAQSFRLTAHDVLLLFGLTCYFLLAITLGGMTIIGYFFIFPYIILMKAFLMKALLFKELNEIR